MTKLIEADKLLASFKKHYFDNSTVLRCAELEINGAKDVGSNYVEAMDKMREIVRSLPEGPEYLDDGTEVPSTEHLLSKFYSIIKDFESTLSDTDKPYIEELNVRMRYNPKFGDDRKCICGHSYARHFDSYDNMEPCGCKYCDCYCLVEQDSTQVENQEKPYIEEPTTVTEEPKDFGKTYVCTCGFKETEEEKLVGIFPSNASLYGTNGTMVGLYGCPKCGAVTWTNDIAYINKRKQEYKDSWKKNN